jgi:hypothetical protein
MFANPPIHGVGSRMSPLRIFFSTSPVDTRTGPLQVRLPQLRAMLMGSGESHVNLGQSEREFFLFLLLSSIVTLVSLCGCAPDVRIPENKSMVSGVKAQKNNHTGTASWEL